MDLFSRSFLTNASAAYTALQGNLAATQTPDDTISKLVDRLEHAHQSEDRRASLLALKALARDCKRDVGRQAFDALLTVLNNGVQEDVEVAKACLETLTLLCESDEVDIEGEPPKPRQAQAQDVGLILTNQFLTTPNPIHALLALLSVQHFYVRFFTLQLISVLLQNSPDKVQEYVLTSPGGVRMVMECLEERREVLRNEALLLLHNLTVTNADLQKIVAFEGAFERLFDIVDQEGGIEGGVVVQDCLAAIGTLLRFNSSNQNYFRELSQIARLPPLLMFPSPPPALSEPAPDNFALQFWPDQKIINASLVIGLVKLIVGSGGSGAAGNQTAMLTSGMTRCLIEFSMASNAPVGLKAQALSALSTILHHSPANQTYLSSLQTTPLLTLPPDEHSPSPQSVGYTRLSLRPASAVLLSLAINGEEDPAEDGGWKGPGLKLRKAALALWMAFLSGGLDGSRAVREGILAGLKELGGKPLGSAGEGSKEGEETTDGPSAPAVLLASLSEFPTSGEFYDPYKPTFAALLFGHLLKNSEMAKTVAREITFSTAPSDEPIAPDEIEDEEDKVSLVQVVVGNLMMALREHTEALNRESNARASRAKVKGAAEEAEREEDDEEGVMTARDWSRAMVGWLVLLSTWLWDSPGTVREFLSEGASVQVLIQPITQPSGIDPLLQGLSAFLLGICYEFNRDPGEITRSTLHPILHGRIGPDQFVSRMARLREDPRFRAVGPPDGEDEAEGEELAAGLALEKEDWGDVWFDWDFVEFWKNNYYTIQRAINSDPESGFKPADVDSDSASLIASLKAQLHAQEAELTESRKALSAVQKELDGQRVVTQEEIASLSLSVSMLTTSLQTATDKHAEDTKEQEDLLVLLEELSQKRKKDKERLVKLGEDVSEDEDGGDEDEED